MKTSNIKTLLMIGLAGLVAGNILSFLVRSWGAGFFASVIIWLVLGVKFSNRSKESEAMPPGWTPERWREYLKHKAGE